MATLKEDIARNEKIKPIKVGSYVKCIKPGRESLTKNKIYKIHNHDGEHYTLIGDDNEYYGYFRFRFKKATKKDLEENFSDIFIRRIKNQI